MNWFLIAIASYFILAVVNLVDKKLLVSLIPSPRIYAFYVGSLSALMVVLIPFVDFHVPDFWQSILALSAGAVFILAILQFYRALKLFEASRIVPAVGGLTPIFSVFLIYFLGNELLPFSKWPAFLLLLCGSVLINWSRKRSVTYESFLVSLSAAFLFALSFVFSGYVYLSQPFWSGLIMMKLGGLVVALGLFIFFKEIKAELFKHRMTFQKEVVAVFIANQVAGAGANILQNWAIALSPLVFVPVINALQGTQYVFLLILSILFSLRFPKLLKEEISSRIIIQKAIAIVLIVIATALLFTPHLARDSQPLLPKSNYYVQGPSEGFTK